jgi:methylmalonyl-CoA/ethylmalonyl-CoA epimerase
MIGGLTIDHIGLTTPDLEAALADLGSHGAEIIRGPLDNLERGVRQAFVRVRGGETIELLMPLPGAVSPITRHASNGGGAHHICFVVSNIAEAVGAARQAGAHVVVAPTPDAAFEGRLIAFLFDRLYGLVELLESDRRPRSDSIQARPQQESTRLPERDVEAALAQVFADLFPALRETGVKAARLEVTPGWDSLGHIRLIMSLEQRLGMTIPSSAIAQLVDYDAVERFVTRRSSKRS